MIHVTRYKLQVTRYKLQDARRAMSLLLVIFIVGALLTSAALVGDIVIRQARMTRGVVDSEAAIYAAESASEKVAYKVLKEHCVVGGGNCGVSGTLDNGASYAAADSSSNITTENATSPWSFSLTAGQSFTLYLDVRGVSYPSGGNLRITCTTSNNLTNADVIREVIATGAQTETLYTDFSLPVDVAIDVDSDPYPLKSYYKITIHNRNTISQDYQLSWTGNLPKSLKIIKASGTSQSYHRIIESLFPRWQIFGGS